MVPTTLAPLTDLKRMSRTMRAWIITQSFDSKVGHIGSALSVVEIMAVLWGRVLRGAGTSAPDRDYFVLSKGHAALALYCAFRWNGLIDAATFQTYCKDGTLLGVHPEVGTPGVDIAAGSLGQGLSIACGLAYGLKLRGSEARVYTLLSDAECNEGQVWEAAMFAAHQRLNNLTALVDVNGMQALGRTRDVLDLGPMKRRWQEFGWLARDVNGHDEAELLAALEENRIQEDGPFVVLAHTALGKGVSFMEDRLEWHYRNLTPELAKKALAEIAQAEEP